MTDHATDMLVKPSCPAHTSDELAERDRDRRGASVERSDQIDANV
jgi:hypothetical protein